MSEAELSAPTSPSGSSSKRSSRTNSLRLDLSNLPPLEPPAQPTNTLLITNLQDPDIFRPDNLQTIRDLVSQVAPLHSWAPLRSFRRIIASFYSAEAAIAVRKAWDGERIMGERCAVYFGRATPLDDDHTAKLLALPDAGKLFFISPPPSPPHDWEMRLEDAPNKQVHADDLADALAKLHHHAHPAAGMTVSGMESPVSPVDGSRPTRSRSSTLIYQPGDHGSDLDLPAISVDDFADEPEPMPMSGIERPILAHTARPPVELMHNP